MQKKFYITIVAIYWVLCLLRAFVGLRSGFRMVFFDVGEGDSIMIQDASNKVLIDTGPDNSVSYVGSSYFIPLLCHINYLILTHFHKDHYGGLPRLISLCSIGTFTFNDISLPEIQKLGLGVLLQKNKYKKIFSGDEFVINKTKIIILYPSRFQKPLTDPNDRSIIVLVKRGSFDALLLGDAEINELSKLDLIGIQQLIVGDLDVIKVSHHGSLTGLYKPLYETLKPKNCVISYGDNKFGHPNPEVISYLKSLPCKVYSTALDGNVEFNSQ